MKKNQLQQNKIINIFVILLMMFTFIGMGKCYAAAAPLQNAPAATQSPIQQTTAQNKKSDNVQTIPEKNAYALTHMEKKGFKYSLFKFFMAMLGVLVSSLAIFLGLKFYKKIMAKKGSMPDNFGHPNSLESPKNFKEAINLFLDKTDK